jgi:hypothetical protein
VNSALFGVDTCDGGITASRDGEELHFMIFSLKNGNRGSPRKLPKSACWRLKPQVAPRDIDLENEECRVVVRTINDVWTRT